eukprot:XP_027302544.1 uncharacterized protein C9orf85 homolog [Anas platyrhynchos]
MSSQRGNAVRRRPQRHQNTWAFSNRRHDASSRRKVIVELVLQVEQAAFLVLQVAPLILDFCRIDKGQDRSESKNTENGQESGSEDEPDFDTNFSSTDNEEDADVLEERLKNMNFKRTEV